MDCQNCQNYFSDYLEHDLDLDLTSRLSSHLATCPDCAEEWRLFQQTVQLLHQIPMQSAPADFLVGVQEKLQPGGILAKLQKFFTVKPALLATSSGLALVMVGIISAAIFKTGILPDKPLTDTLVAGSQTSSQQTTLVAAVSDSIDYYPGVPQLSTYNNQAQEIFKPSPLIARLKQEVPQISYVSTSNSAGLRQQANINTPDLHITLQARSRNEQLQRVHQLIHASTGEIKTLNNNNVLLAIPSQGIGQLQHLCSQHDTICRSYSGHNNHYVPPKRHITVAVQLQ